MADSSQVEPDALPEYNILLLGESGAGKTLFVNSFINYVAYETLVDAQNGSISVVIPVKFNVTDDKNQLHEMEEGVDDGNECLENPAHSSTSECRSYLINFDTFRVRLIDTPGVGSTVVENEAQSDQSDNHVESVEQDRKYVEEVLEFVSHFDHLHAIAIVVKSNETRYTTRFKRCLQQLLSGFNKSAIDNLFFILTFGEGTRFKADIVKQPLKTLLGKVTLSTPEDLLSPNKVYSVDNKSFSYLLAVKKGAWFTDLERMICENAWTQSRNDCKRLIDYITGQGGQCKPKPHRVTDTLSINEARKFINMVEKLMKDILTVIDQNKQALNGYLASSSKEDEQISEFENRLSEKEEDVEITKVELPQTTCKSSKCAKLYRVDGDEKTHYSQICCEGCKVVIMKRLFCTAFELLSGNCKVCGCHIGYHHSVYFTTKIVIKEIKDKDAILKEMASATDNKQKMEKMRQIVEMKLKKIDNEKSVIENAQSLFKNFLKTNAIIPGVDGSSGDAEIILPEEVFAIKNQLLNLEKFGPAIKEAYNISKEGEKEGWLATKERFISVKNTFSKLYRRQSENSDGKVKHSTAIVSVSSKEQ